MCRTYKKFVDSYSAGTQNHVPHTPDRKANAVYVHRIFFVFHCPQKLLVPFKPRQSLSDDGESSAWQRRQGCCVTRMLVFSLLQAHHLPSWIFAQSSPGCRSGRRVCVVDVRNGVSTTGHGALARAAVPDTGRLAADGDLAAESAGVLGVLADFHLLDLLTQRSTVAVSRGSVSVGCKRVCLQCLIRPKPSVVYRQPASSLYPAARKCMRFRSIA